MEKRKTNLTVEDFEDKKYGAGKRYTRFKTSEGWISSFDKKVIEKLKDSEEKKVSVEIVTDDDDREKITKFFGDAEESDDDEALIDKRPIKAKDAFKGSKRKEFDKDPIGLAVEIYCACKGELEMKECIKRVEEAQTAFS